MELQHINIKINLEGDHEVEPATIMALFHEWVREQVFEDLLIDIADYSHVPNGPGIIVIGHEADYSLDHSNGERGLRYNRKAPLDGSNADRLRQAIVSACRACTLFEAGFEDRNGISFDRSAFEAFVNDRALAPNTTETQEAFEQELKSFLAAALGHSDFDFTRARDARARVGVIVTSANAFDIAACA